MRKLIALLAALMLCAMPFAGVAEEEASWMDQLAAALNAEEARNYMQDAIANGRRVTTTISVEDVADTFTGQPAIDHVIVDVLGALQITTYEQEDEIAFALSMKQATGRIADLFSFAVAADEEGAYLTSNLLGSGVIYLKAIDIMPLAERVIRLMGDFGMLPMDAEEFIAEIKTALEAYSVEIGAAAEEEAVQTTEVSEIDFAELDKVVLTLLEKAVTTDVTMQPRGVDMAAKVSTLTITSEDVQSLLAAGVRFIQANPSVKTLLEAEIYEKIKLAYSSAYGEIPTFDEILEQMLAEVDEVTMPGELTITIWEDEKEMPVAAEIVLPVASELRQPEAQAADEAAATMDLAVEYVTITYGRLTLNDGVANTVVIKADDVDMTIDLLVKERNIHAQLAVAENGASVCTATVDVTDKSGENTEAYDMVFTMDIPDEQEPMSFTMKMSLSVVFDGVDFTEVDTVTIGVNGKDYATIRFDMRSGEPGVSIRDGRIINPVNLNEADFANWFVEVYNSIYS